jgi:hypothetical protein
VRSRRLKERLAGCDEWIEFSASLTAWPLLDGYANGDAFRADWGDGLVGTTLRLFDPKTDLWSIWWAPDALHLDARSDAALGAGVLRGRREHVGDQLDHGLHARP